MEPAQAEAEAKDEKATPAATGSASAEESAQRGAPAADGQPAVADGEQGPSDTEAKEGGAEPGNDAAKGQESGSDAAGLWMYLDGVNPTQHGPLTERAMLKLLRIGTAHKDMMAWSQGMSAWQPLGQVSLVASLVLFLFRVCCFFKCIRRP